MGFTIQSISRRPGGIPYRVTRATKKEALDIAIGLIAQGMSDITITDEQGHVYHTGEFVDLIEESSEQSS